MTVKLPSGGKIELAFKCLGSVVLPIVKDEGGPEAEAGKEKHATLEEFFKGERKDRPDAPEHSRDLCSRAAKTVGTAYAEWSELGLAVNPDGRISLWDRGRLDNALDSILGYNAPAGMVNRSVVADGNLVAAGGSDGGGLSLGGTESIDRSDWFVAIADLVQWRGANSFAVFDWKSGSWATDPKYNWQLLLPATYLYIAAGRPTDFQCGTNIVYVGKPTSDGGFETARENVLGAAEAERCLSALSWLRRNIERSDGRVTLYEGKHCNYCPARHRCPAKVGALERAMVNLKNGLKYVPDIELISISQALMEAKPQIDKMAKNVLRANGGEMVMTDGRVAVLKKDAKGREKVYTKKNVKETTAGSNAEEDDSSGTETE